MLLQHAELTGLIRVLKYYAYFRYAATSEDIYSAYPYKVSRHHMELILRTAVAEKRILTRNVAGTSYYTLPPQGIALHEIERKIKTANEKLSAVNAFLWAAKYNTVVSLIGLTGSLAMKNAGKNDDVDFFVISAPNRVWTARITLLVLAAILGLRRTRNDSRPSGKVCLNLFFDGTDLEIPIAKQSLYTAHEIVHMQPQFMRNQAYKEFLQANRWIEQYFPNARTLLDSRQVQTIQTNDFFFTPVTRAIGDMLEKLFKLLQQKIIAKHRTNELVSNTQMWFYPDDFEKKLRSAGIVAIK